jgi:hypothetical protein
MKSIKLKKYFIPLFLSFCVISSAIPLIPNGIWLYGAVLYGCEIVVTKIGGPVNIIMGWLT